MSPKWRYFCRLYITVVVVTTLSACVTGPEVSPGTRQEPAAARRPPVPDSGETPPTDRAAMARIPPERPTDIQREREELLKYQEAVRLFREEGRLEEALERFESFLIMHPKSGYADDALLEQARIRLYQDDPEEAARLLNSLLRRFPASPLRKRAFLELQKIYHADEKWRNCVEAGHSVLELEPLPDERSEALTLRGVCLARRNAAGEALEDLVQGYRAAITIEARRQVTEAIESIKGDLRDRHLDRALAGSDGQEPYGQLAMIRLERDIERGLYQSAMTGLMDILVHYPGQIPIERVDAAYMALTSRLLVKSDTIGVILPLSGTYAVFGQSALQGIQAALGYMLPVTGDREPPRFNLVVRDTAADPVQAAQAVRDLVAEDQVIGIIGPLFSRTSRAAAEAAMETGTPLVTLTADPDIPPLGREIFSRTLTDQQQVTALVQLAFDRLGIRRFAFLYPDSSYGQELMHLFWDELDRAGARVTAAESFPPGGTDFGPQIRSLVGLDRPLNEEEKQLKEEGVEVQPEPIVDFEGLFIPADFQTVGLLAPQLAFYDVNQVLVMGASGWNSPWLPELGEHYVEGAVFTGGFTPESGDPEARRLMQDYWLSFGEDPRSISVQAYDVASIITTAVDSGQVRDRAGLTEYLANLYAFPSAEGPLTTDGNGVIRQKPFLFTVHRGEIRKFPFTMD